MLTGRVLDDDDGRPAAALRGLVRRLGEPVIRTAVGRAMREMGEQFVLGRDHRRGDEARARRSRPRATSIPTTCSARRRAPTPTRSATRAPTPTPSRAIADASTGDIRSNPGISVKLSALHPRYEWSAAATTCCRCCAERLLALARAARAGAHGLQHRRRGGRPARPVARRHRGACWPIRQLAGWDGFGVVVQAYGRRAGASSSTGSTRWRESSTAGSWCGWSRAPTGTPRSSGRRSWGCPAIRSSPARPTPTSPTSPARASCCR